MSDWPQTAEKWGVGNWVIGVTHPLALGSGIRAANLGNLSTSTAWPAANLAKFIPFRLPRQVTAYQMAAGGGATATGNVDLGIYDEFGNLIVSSGAIAKPNSTEIIANITDTVIGPGLYYMAMSADGTQNLIGVTAAQVGLVKATGVKQMATAYTLPNPATYATVSDGFIPSIGVWLRSE